MLSFILLLTVACAKNGVAALAKAKQTMQVVAKPMSMEDAEKYCVAHGSALATPHCEYEEQFLNWYMTQHAFSEFFVGYAVTPEDGGFMDYWLDHLKKNAKKNAGCVVKKREHHKWNIVSCKNQELFACYKRREFEFVQTPMTFRKANEHCAATYGTTVAVPRSMWEQRRMVQKIWEKFHEDIWIGAELGTDKKFRCSGFQEELCFAAVDKKKVTAGVEGKNCVVLKSGKNRWEVGDCEQKHPFFCLKEFTGVTVTYAPTQSPTKNPSAGPTVAPSKSPTTTTKTPTAKPTKKPTGSPTFKPTKKPTEKPTSKPTSEPTAKPTESPTSKPTAKPTNKPTENPTSEPTAKPTKKPTKKPTAKPTSKPTKKPTSKPTAKPTKKPTEKPTAKPTGSPTSKPTEKPTGSPTKKPSATPAEEMNLGKSNAAMSLTGSSHNNEGASKLVRQMYTAEAWNFQNVPLTVLNYAFLVGILCCCVACCMCAVRCYYRVTRVDPNQVKQAHSQTENSTVTVSIDIEEGPSEVDPQMVELEHMRASVVSEPTSPVYQTTAAYGEIPRGELSRSSTSESIHL